MDDKPLHNGFIYDTQLFPNEPVMKPLEIDRSEFFGNQPTEPFTFTFDATPWDGTRICTICKGTFTPGLDLAVLTENGHRIGDLCQPCVAAITATP